MPLRLGGAITAETEFDVVLLAAGSEESFDTVFLYVKADAEADREANRHPAWVGRLRAGRGVFRKTFDESDPEVQVVVDRIRAGGAEVRYSSYEYPGPRYTT